MATEAVTVFTGDTIRVKITFRAFAEPPAVGAVTDTDDLEATWTIYDAKGEVVLDTGDAVRESQGVYYYDYTTPLEPSSVVLEMKGVLNSKPQLSRVKINAKFNSAAAIG